MALGGVGGDRLMQPQAVPTGSQGISSYRPQIFTHGAIPQTQNSLRAVPQSSSHPCDVEEVLGVELEHPEIPKGGFNGHNLRPRKAAGGGGGWGQGQKE